MQHIYLLRVEGRMQQSAALCAPGWKARQLSLPQMRPAWHSLLESQSPSPSPHLLAELQQLQALALPSQLLPVANRNGRQSQVKTSFDFRSKMCFETYIPIDKVEILLLIQQSALAMADPP